MTRLTPAWMTLLTVALTLTLSRGVGLAQTPAPSAAAPISAATPASAPPAAARPLTIAVLDFESSLPGNPDLGRQISQTMQAILSAEPSWRLVERAALTQALHEQELSLTGLVDTQQAVQVGKLAGARVIITGKAFALGKKLFITAKLIGVETSLVDGVLVQGEAETPLDELVLRTTQEVSQRLANSAGKLLPPDAGPDPLEQWRRVLAGRTLPRIAVVVRETHLAEQRPVQIDPAVETEIKKTLADLGVTLVDVDANELADWVPSAKPGTAEAWPRSLARADWVVTGEAFSEFSARLGQLVSCSARAEINVIDHQNGNIILADRATTRAVDLAENLAGKTALQRAGRELALTIAQRLAQTTAPAAPAATRP